MGRDAARNLQRGLLNAGFGTTAPLGICITGCLSLGGGVRLGDLAFFTAGGSLGDRSCFGTASGFDPLRRGSAGGFFGIAQSTPHG